MIYNQRNTHQWITWTKTKPSKQFRRKTLNFFAWFPRSSRKFDMTRTKSMWVKSIFIWKSRNRQTKRGRNTTLVQLSEKLKKIERKITPLFTQKEVKPKIFRFCFTFPGFSFKNLKDFNFTQMWKKKNKIPGGAQNDHLTFKETIFLPWHREFP